jgi:hypothetical protein
MQFLQSIYVNCYMQSQQCTKDILDFINDHRKLFGAHRMVCCVTGINGVYKLLFIFKHIQLLPK